jgi:hypothetical protein
VATTFTSNGRPDPRCIIPGTSSPLLREQLKGYASIDPAATPQAALPLDFFRYQLEHRRDSPLYSILATLLSGAFFFAMRSCEYLHVSGIERKTKLLVVGDILFYRHGLILPHTHPNLHLADAVSIVFRFQKNDNRDEKVTQHRSGDQLLCPVLLWANVIRRIRSYPTTTDTTTIDTYSIDGGPVRHLTSNVALSYLRFTATIIGKRYNLLPMSIGLHSIRCSAAMALVLGCVPVYQIMLLGRWKSTAFLAYVRTQVHALTDGISSQMLLHPSFLSIPSTTTATRLPPVAPELLSELMARGIAQRLDIVTV